MKLNNASDSDIKSEKLWWDLALLFTPSTPRPPNNPSKADSSVLSTFMENCVMWIDVIGDASCITHARESRNAIMHSGTMQIAPTEFEKHVRNFLSVLEDDKELKDDMSCHDARKKIDQLRDNKNKVVIDLVKKEESNIVREHFQQVEDKIKLLSTEIQTSKDQDFIDNNIQLIEELQEVMINKKATMDFLQIESTSAGKAKYIISDAYHRAIKRKTDMETSSIRRENEGLKKHTKVIKDDLEEKEKENKELQKRLEDQSKKENEELGRMLQEKAEENLELSKRLKEQTKVQVSANDHFIEESEKTKNSVNILEDTKLLQEGPRTTELSYPEELKNWSDSSFSQEDNGTRSISYAKGGSWICECGLLNSNQFVSCSYCGEACDSCTVDDDFSEADYDGDTYKSHNNVS